MREKIAGWRRSRLGQDLTKLALAQGFVKLCALFGSTIAIRALGPAEVSRMGGITAVGGLMSIVFGFGVELSGPRVIAGGDQLDIVSRVRSVLSFRSFTLCCAACISVLFVAIKFKYFDLVDWRPECIVLLLGGVLIWVNAAAPTIILQGLQKLSSMAKAQVVTAVFSTICFFAVAEKCPRAEAYLGVQILSIFMLGWLSLQYADISLRGLLWRWRDVGAAWRYMKKGGAVSLGLSSVFLYIYGQGDSLVVAMRGEGDEVGNFYAALAVIAATNSIVGLIPSAIYSRQMAWLKSNGFSEFKRRTSITLMVLFAVSIIAATLSILIGPFFAGKILGAGFSKSPIIFAILLAVSLVNLIYAVLASALVVLGRSQEVAKIAFLIGALSLVVYNYAYEHYGVIGVVLGKAIMLLAMIGGTAGVYARTRSAIEGL